VNLFNLPAGERLVAFGQDGELFPQENAHVGNVFFSSSRPAFSN